ncbi:MAG: FAD-dependent oxidoreductase [Thermoplasmatales archaeon]|nr:FAD-dependent oxidoreductase [Thermoplasmatales archaeon]MCK5261460.1 FAD-dependent oxidoreductase [Thermoplasmatales archaeon]
MRIRNHPIIDFKKKRKIPFYFNKRKIYGEKGDTIASALHANDVKVLSHSLRYDRPRGFFCGIGKCSSCFMTVDDIPNVRTCIMPVKKDIKVMEQDKGGELSNKQFIDKYKKRIDVEIVIVGSGPAGLMAALAAAQQGASVLLIDENHMVGGQLVKQTHRFFGSREEKAGMRGIEIAVELMEKVAENKENIQLMLATTVIGCYNGKKHHKLIAVQKLVDGDHLFEINGNKIIVACGALENMLAFPGNDLPGVYGAGGVQTLMNVYGVKPGNRVLMVGAGNVGLIVSYQLLQAGVTVDRVVEVMPRIGGYHVHAAKLRRCGVPIYTSYSIKEAYGNGKVEGAVVVEVDDYCQPIPGTEQNVPCDTICLAVGLTPSIRLLEQIGVRTEFILEAGGHVAVHDLSMQTNVRGIYVAGDSSGIEEASTAMTEGQIAGVSAAASLGYDKNAREVKRKCRNALKVFRSGPFGEIPRIGKEKIACCRRNGGLTY